MRFIVKFSIPVDVTPPTSSVSPIEPYWQFSAPFIITATATDDLSGVSTVELWYRHSYDNKTWGPWENFGFGRENVERPGQWFWEFTCPENEGYYEFYSVATDKAGNRENAEPKLLVPEARCGVLDVLRWFPIFIFSSDEKYFPCSFYFGYDTNVDTNPSNYDGGIGLWYRPYCYVHPIENGEYFALHYWLYYAYNSWGLFYLPPFDEHDHDWERLGIVFKKDNLKEPWKVAFYHHIWAEDEFIFWDKTEKEGTHVLTYVASGSHGTYPSAREADAAWADSFERPGIRYSPEFFHVYIVGECVKENTYSCFPGPWWHKGHETREFCLVQNRLIKGDPQPEPLGGYWPKRFPGSDKVAPWHREDKWNVLLPGRRAKSAFILNASCPILVKVYDPAGRCVGIDFESREIVAEIPDAIVAPVRGSKLYIEILNPPSGEFRIEIYGLENGRYSLKASLLDLENEQICYRVIIENQLTRSSEIQKMVFDSRSPKSYKWRAEGLSKYALKLHSKPENIFIKRKLELISSFIDKSMENWIDDWHLRFPMGLKIFDEKLAICELAREVLKTRIDQKTKDLLVEMMANLVQADHLLAKKSIEEAERIAKGARILLLELSKLKYQKADQAAQKGLFEQAIILYKQSWRLSQLCFP